MASAKEVLKHGKFTQTKEGWRWVCGVCKKKSHAAYGDRWQVEFDFVQNHFNFRHEINPDGSVTDR